MNAWDLAHAAVEGARFEAVLREAADRYLTSTHATIFARSHDVLTEEGRERAIEFIVKVFQGIAATWDEAERVVIAKEALDDIHRRHGCTACGSLKR